LIERSARDQLGGEATVDFLPRGVVYTVSCALENESWGGGLIGSYVRMVYQSRGKLKGACGERDATNCRYAHGLHCGPLLEYP
jgi:hypothetical protein